MLTRRFAWSAAPIFILCIAVLGAFPSNAIAKKTGLTIGGLKLDESSIGRGGSVTAQVSVRNLGRKAETDNSCPPKNVAEGPILAIGRSCLTTVP